MAKTVTKTVNKPEVEVGERVIRQEDFNLDRRIPVKSAAYGKLIYRDPRTQLKYTWTEMGQVEYMTLGELQTMRNAKPKYFEENWIEIGDDAVLEWLNAKKFYKNSISIDEFESLFEKSPDQIEKIVTKMPKGQKESLKLRAKELIETEAIDSMKVIKALEKALNCKFGE